jgi:4a-hydroxytetrahydrobiopterin dehydratase
MLQQTPGWEIIDSTIQRSFTVSDFVSAMEFANKITPVAQEQDHHPDLHISYGRVRVELSTHKVGGLSRNDFVMAAKLNKLWDSEEHRQAI